MITMRRVDCISKDMIHVRGPTFSELMRWRVSLIDTITEQTNSHTSDVYCALLNHFFKLNWPIFSTAIFTSFRSTAHLYLINSFPVPTAGAAVATNTFCEISVSQAYGTNECKLESKKQEAENTLVRIWRLHRIIPILPPPTCTGAERDVRSWSRKASWSISNVTASCPEVRAWIAAITRQIEG